MKDPGPTVGVPVAGIVLAAGAGTRYGRPKATVSDSGGSWLARVCTSLNAAGVEPVVVVLGAGADEAGPLVPAAARIVVAEDWAEGMAASLRAGLTATGATQADAVVIALVDQPDLPAEVVAAVARGATRRSLRRATFAGVPGHPVLIGRDHWSDLARHLVGDRGAGPWLARMPVEPVPADRWWDGADHDRPEPAEAVRRDRRGPGHAPA